MEIRSERSVMGYKGVGGGGGQEVWIQLQGVGYNYIRADIRKHNYKSK